MVDNWQLIHYISCISISVTGVAAGHTHIHGKGILHNDVKTDNIALGDCLPANKETPVAGVWPTIVDFGKACPSKHGKKCVFWAVIRERCIRVAIAT